MHDFLKIKRHTYSQPILKLYDLFLEVLTVYVILMRLYLGQDIIWVGGMPLRKINSQQSFKLVQPKGWLSAIVVFYRGFGQLLNVLLFNRPHKFESYDP